MGHFCDVCFQENGSVHLTSLTAVHICYLLFLDPMKRNHYCLEIFWKCVPPFPHFLSFPSLLSLPSRLPSPHVLLLLSFHFLSACSICCCYCYLDSKIWWRINLPPPCAWPELCGMAVGGKNDGFFSINKICLSPHFSTSLSSSHKILKCAIIFQYYLKVLDKFYIPYPEPHSLN